MVGTILSRFSSRFRNDIPTTPLHANTTERPESKEDSTYFGRINNSVNEYVSLAKGIATESINAVSDEASKRLSDLTSGVIHLGTPNVDSSLQQHLVDDAQPAPRRFFMIDPYKRVSGQDNFLASHHQNSVWAVRNLLQVVKKEDEYRPLLNPVKATTLVRNISSNSEDLCTNSFEDEFDQSMKNPLSSVHSTSSHASESGYGGRRLNRQVSKAETASRLGEGTLRAMRDLALSEAVELHHSLKFWTERLERPFLYYLEFAPTMFRSKQDHHAIIGQKISQLQAVLARRCSSIGELQQQIWRAGWQSGVEQWGILGQGEWAAVVGLHGEIEDSQRQTENLMTPVNLAKPHRKRYSGSGKRASDYYEESHLFVRNVRGGEIQSNDDALAAWTIDAIRVVRDQLYGAGNALKPLPYYENWPREYRHFSMDGKNNQDLCATKLGDSMVNDEVRIVFKDEDDNIDLPLWATVGIGTDHEVGDGLEIVPSAISINRDVEKIEIADLNLMASEVAELLNSMETNMSMQKKRRLEKLRPPSLLVRSWYVAAFVLPIIGYSTYRLIQAEDNIFGTFAQDVYQKVCSFCVEHVYDPLRAIYRELFTKRGRENVTDRKAREDVIVVLRKMIKAWLDDTYPMMTESERTERAIRMDMSLIESTKEYSVKNILDFNKIYRLSLIEMQFIKKELLNSLVQMDELMGANEINMNLAAITPAFLALSSIRFIFHKFFYALLKVGKSKEETFFNFRQILLDIERLLVMRDNPPPSLLPLSFGNSNRFEEDTSEKKPPRNVLSSDDLGMLMLLVHECRIILWQDRKRFTRSELRNVSEDLAELAGERGAYNRYSDVERSNAWKMSENSISNCYARCTMEDNDSSEWSQETSPWFQYGPFDCIWPLDETDTRLCDTGAHFRRCSSGNTCGSDYDAFGNPRFVNAIEPYGIPRMDIALHEENLNWGLTGFDSFPQAMITIFQIITLEGWSDILEQITDVWYKPPAFIFFGFQIVLCGYIVLNVVLAIISKSLDKLGKDNGASSSEEANQIRSFKADMKDTYLVPICVDIERDGKKWLFRRFIGTKIHSTIIMTCIFLNSVVLSMDYYGISQHHAAILDYLNLLFAIIFFLDVLICNIHYGFRRYWRNSTMCFDGVLGILSFFELIIYAIPRATSGSFAAFRALRLFRLLKLARNWKSLQNLLRTITSSLPDIANFGALLAIIVFVFSLVGMQVLAGRLQFDSSTKGVQFSTDRDALLEVPRANFDNIYWSTITVFQLLTGEDWNRIMYDGWRVRGSAAVLFVTLVITVGNFVVMNLFLAILLKNFEERNNADESLKIIDERLLVKSGIIVKHQSIIRTNCSFMDKDNFLRRICFRIVESWKFDVLVTLLIVVSSICILLDNPLADPRADYVLILHFIEWGVTIFFIFEAVVKILGYGLIAANDSYLRSGWNILDFFLVIVSILNMKNIGPGNVLRPLRTLRVLRPLRMISRFKELKVVVDALLSAIPAVSDVGILCSLTFVIFSCFGVSFLKGTFYRCGVTAPSYFEDYEMSIMTYPETINLLSKNERELFRTKHLECESLWYNEDIPTSKEVCLCLGGAWVPVVSQNFDNVLNGIALLFEISTTEGWVQVMHAAVDQRGVDMEPVRNHSPIWAMFFVIFILICAFFLVELFVGVVLENFSGIRRRSGSGLMTESQRNWARTQTFLLKIKPIRNVARPSNPIRSSMYDMAYGIGASKFEGFVTCCICLSAMNLSLSSFGDSQMKMNAVNSINAVFTIIFGLEAIFKLGAIGWYYFDDRWNCFDFVVAVLTTVGLFFDEQAVAVTPLRFVRLFRILRLLKNVEKLRQLFNTLVISIPSVANIGGLILLIFFIYAILGVQLFCFLPEHGDLTEEYNFRSFGNACLLLFRFATGENWNGFMRNMLISVDNCQETQIYDPDLPWCLNENDHPNCTPLLGCGAGISAYLYFYSFVLVVSFVILNLFVGIVLEAFETSAEGGDLSPRDLDEFIRAWSIFDTKASGFIPAMSMKKLVMELSLPLGIGDRTNYKKAQEVMNHQCLKDLPITKDGKVNIVHAATQLAKRVTIEKVGDEFIDLSDDHPLQRRLKATAKDSDRTLNELYIEKSKKKLRVLRAFARAKIKPEDLFSSSV